MKLPWQTFLSMYNNFRICRLYVLMGEINNSFIHSINKQLSEKYA